MMQDKTDRLVRMNRQYLEFHKDDIDALVLALQKLRAGPLGRIALDLEANPAKPAANASHFGEQSDLRAPEPEKDENEDERMFVNHYRCDRCDHEWQDEWTATCDDDCPECGLRHMTPYKSEDAG